MGICPDTIKRLVDRFTQQADQIRSPDYNEPLIRIDREGEPFTFINPLMAELGWDIENKQGFAEQYREVVHEDRVKVAGANKAPDYSLHKRLADEKREQIEREIAATDRQIDQLIHQLYGLTEEELKIVEEATR